MTYLRWHYDNGFSMRDSSHIAESVLIGVYQYHRYPSSATIIFYPCYQRWLPIQKMSHPNIALALARSKLASSNQYNSLITDVICCLPHTLVSSLVATFCFRAVFTHNKKSHSVSICLNVLIV